jgi:beta-lactamase superfamily II metal-dependent hydrolase
MSLKIHFLDVGEGNCTLVEFPNGKKALVDCNVEEDKVTPITYIQRREINRLDYLIITHPHQDHIRGISDIYRRLAIGEFWVSNIEFKPDPIHQDWEVYEKMKKTFQPVFYVTENQYEPLDGDRITVLAPPKVSSNTEEEVNDLSIVLLITYGSTKILLAGDNEERSWERIRYKFPDRIRNATILLASHHGRDSGYFRPTVERIAPLYTVFSRGKKTENDAYEKYYHYTRKMILTTTKYGTLIATCQRDGSCKWQHIK